jgi:hypothetical protein
MSWSAGQPMLEWLVPRCREFLLLPLAGDPTPWAVACPKMLASEALPNCM